MWVEEIEALEGDIMALSVGVTQPDLGDVCLFSGLRGNLRGNSPEDLFLIGFSTSELEPPTTTR